MILTLTCLFLSSMILVICIFFRPMVPPFPVSLTIQQNQKNNTLSSAALLAHCATVPLLVDTLSPFSTHSSFPGRPQHDLQEDKKETSGTV